MDDIAIREVRDRCRRIETRLTKYMMQQGFDAETQSPVWHDAGIIEVPSPATPLHDLLRLIPRGWSPGATVAVMHKGEVICRIMSPNL